MSDTGAKSASGSYASFEKTTGATTNRAGFTTSIVAPSAGWPLTNSVPMRPPAPGLFSTMTVWPRESFSLSAMSRATTSEPPPAGYGTTILMGPLISCARGHPRPEQADNRSDDHNHAQSGKERTHDSTSFRWVMGDSKSPGFPTREKDLDSLLV